MWRRGRRNTFAIGRVVARFLSAEPYEYDGNVIFRDDQSQYQESIITHPVVDDLVGDTSSGILDDNDNLTPAFADHLGTHGYQVQ